MLLLLVLEPAAVEANTDSIQTIHLSNKKKSPQTLASTAQYLTNKHSIHRSKCNLAAGKNCIVCTVCMGFSLNISWCTFIQPNVFSNFLPFIFNLNVTNKFLMI